MTTRQTQTVEELAQEPDRGWESSSVSSKGGRDKNDSIEHETTSTGTIFNYLEDQRQHISCISEEQFSLSSCSPTIPCSSVSATPMWESTAHGFIRCEETAAGKSISITLSTNPVGSLTSKDVPDWTREAKSRPIAPFRQMRKPLGQDDMAYIRKRLETYYQARHSYIKLDVFDFAVILEDAMTLFSHAELQKSIIATQQTEVSSRKRNIPPAEATDREERIKRQRRR